MSPPDYRNDAKEKQIIFLQSEIVRLECKQLSESIIAIREIQTAYASNADESKEYELCFDDTINVTSMILDYQNVKLLARYRNDILVTSLYDATLASSMKFNTNSSGLNKTVLNLCKGKRGRPINQIQNVAQKIKQIGDLFDKEILDRVVDFEKYGLCHYCKQIKLKSDMVKCTYKNTKIPTQVGKVFNPSCNYKGIVTRMV
jgi:hypothetical protein